MVISATTRTDSHQEVQRLKSCRETIPHRTDVLWRISRGVVRTVIWGIDGTAICLGYWGPGDVVGHALSRVLPYQIEWLTAIECSILPSLLWCQALNAIILHIQQSEELLSIVNLNPVQQRLWQFLVWNGEKEGRDVNQGRLIELRLTHQEMAVSINKKTRVTVTKTSRKSQVKT